MKVEISILSGIFIVLAGIMQGTPGNWEILF
jgi:hypothetical protein